MSLKKRFQEEMITAMKAGEKLKLSCIRMIIASIKNKEIEQKAELSDDEIIKVLRSLVKQRDESITQFTKGGRDDLVQKEKAEIDIISVYLPAQLSEEEIIKVVDQVVADLNVSTKKDMGRVMKECVTKLGSQADGKTINKIVQTKLS